MRLQWQIPMKSAREFPAPPRAIALEPAIKFCGLSVNGYSERPEESLLQSGEELTQRCMRRTCGLAGVSRHAVNICCRHSKQGPDLMLQTHYTIAKL